MVSRVYVIGVGMGNPATLTLEAKDALEQSELVIGSARLLEAFGNLSVRKEALVVADAIVQELQTATEKTAAVVLSGDVGFYSGAARLFEQLGSMRGLDVRTLPGISSLSYVCARLHETWQDAHVVSVHGRACDVIGAVQSHAKTFVLLGGKETAGELCTQLTDRDLGNVRVAVGERLSYADERIVRGTAAELAGQAFDPLCVMLVRNERPLRPVAAGPLLSDDVFRRSKVPMTKEEVRQLAVCKLRVQLHDVVWDVGAGTGSVSVELARAAYAGQVFAVEKTAEALELLEAHKKAFGLANLRVVAGEAPQILAGLPAPNCTFVGGSGGKLPAILDAIRAKNPDARVCLSAVTLETLANVLAYVKEHGIKDVDITQVSIAKARSIGECHLMQAQNPVYLVVW